MLRPPRSHTRRGAVLAVVAILLVFLVGMVAFAIDTGYIAVTRTQLQRAADAGALAGAEKLGTLDREPVPEASARAEVRKFVALNDGLDLRDEDVKMYRYNSVRPAGQRVSEGYSANRPPNAIEVTVRRDALANGRLPLFFAPVLGHREADVRARASCYVMPARGVLPGVPMIPYTMHTNYYSAAVGQAGRDGVDGEKITTTDDWTVKPDGTVIPGPDGVREVVLFGSERHSPGNFGSLDLGSKSNGTPELERQLLYGPTKADFEHPDFRDQVGKDGSLAPPFEVTGDPGLSTSVKGAFEQIRGKARIVPLYDKVTGTGENTTYSVVAFAAATVVDADLQGNPKRVWVQPTRIYTNKVTPADLETATSEGVFTTPKLVQH